MEHPRNRLAPLRNESHLRRESFQNGWPADKDFLSIDQLVKQGFYFLGPGNGDRVQCVYCAGVLSNWQPNDSIQNEHQRNFPQCPFVKSRYKFAEYKDLSVRKASYDGWPPQLRQKPEDLADAGLFYLGYGDKTKCYWCGIGISEWEADDIPMVEHAKISVQFAGQPCPWLIASKGREFADRIVQYGQQQTNQNQASAPPSMVATASASSPVQTTSDPLFNTQIEALKMGFDQISIDEALKNLGNERDINLQSLVQAILEVQSTHASGATSSNIDVNALSQENREMKVKTVCKICGCNPVGLVFMPCGHLITCTECGVEVTNCLVCSSNVAKKIQVYI